MPYLPHLLADDPADGVGGILFHLRRGVGVGIQREPRRVVAQRAGQRFHVYPAFQGQCGEGVAQVMESDVLRADGFQNFIMRPAESVRRKASGSYMVPVLGDGNRYGLRECFLCSAISRSTACCGRANTYVKLIKYCIRTRILLK